MTRTQTSKLIVRVVPPQSSATELLDRVNVKPCMLRQNLYDMAMPNRWLGAQCAVMRRGAAWLRSMPAEHTPNVLDIATPFAGASIDIVIWLQALHDFTRDTVARLLYELARVARLGVIINDLRRSYLAYWGLDCSDMVQFLRYRVMMDHCPCHVHTPLPNLRP